MVEGSLLNAMRGEKFQKVQYDPLQLNTKEYCMPYFLCVQFSGVKQGRWSNRKAGGRSFEKGICTAYDVIITSELTLKGYSSP